MPGPQPPGGDEGLSPEAIADIEAIVGGHANSVQTSQAAIDELVKNNSALTRNNERLTTELAKTMGLVRSLHAQALKLANQAGQIVPAPLEESAAKKGRRIMDGDSSTPVIGGTRNA